MRHESFRNFVKGKEIKLRFCKLGFNPKYSEVGFKQVIDRRSGHKIEVSINDLEYLLFALGYQNTDVYIEDEKIGQYCIKYHNGIMVAQMYFLENPNKEFQNWIVQLLSNMLVHIMTLEVTLDKGEKIITYSINTSNFREVLMYAFFNGFKNYKTWITPKQQEIVDAYKKGFKIQSRPLRMDDSCDWSYSKVNNFMFSLYEYRVAPINSNYVKKLRSAFNNGSTIQSRSSKDNVWVDLDYLPEGELDPSLEYRIKP